MSDRRISFIALGLVSILGCKSQPKELQEWTPADHHNTSNAQQKGQSEANAKSRVAGIDEVTLTTWANKCTICHGRIGEGNGPQAPMYQPKDLTDPAWQDSVTDERLLTSIQEGRNKMPAFALPDNTAKNMVKLVRMLRRRTPEAKAPDSPASASAKTSAGAAPREPQATEKPAPSAKPAPSDSQ